ncbi:hypothetical protein OPV22_012551 [Ensete ventricosum]|uniref:Uncharacterized protein n=1 Tax=Ensete ventricosum TaxID=4639 RepID=A0AAV8QXD6_ENSVE|nr:hypothetical protein OPV22_012551 [Ensete ventricosum]
MHILHSNLQTLVSSMHSETAINKCRVTCLSSGQVMQLVPPDIAHSFCLSQFQEEDVLNGTRENCNQFNQA